MDFQGAQPGQQAMMQKQQNDQNEVSNIEEDKQAVTEKADGPTSEINICCKNGTVSKAVALEDMNKTFNLQVEQQKMTKNRKDELLLVIEQVCGKHP